MYPQGKTKKFCVHFRKIHETCGKKKISYYLLCNSVLINLDLESVDYGLN